MRISIPDTFVPERRYIIDVLCGEFLGLSYEVKIVSGGEDYELELDAAGKLVIRDHFFGHFKDESYLHSANIPVKVIFTHNPFTPEKDISVIYGDEEINVTEDEIVCGADLFASAFFMLTRWEEHVNQTRDIHDRFPASASLAFKAGFLNRPVVNEYVEMLWSMLQYLGCKQRRKERTFTLKLTHDVDMPRWPVGSAIQTLASDLTRRRDIHSAIRNAGIFLASKAGIRKDPFDSFDNLMDCSEEIGIKSHFFFMSGGKSPYDSKYSVDSPSLRGLLERIYSRGHCIGFHPSYYTFNDEIRWGREFRTLSRVSPAPITGGRQHYLRFDVPGTWQIWEDHGMEYDSTLGYADCEGFRCGTCYEYPVFNILRRKKLRLKESPLIVMDGTLASYRKYTPDKMTETVRNLSDKVREYQGDFVVLWHNSSFNVPFWQAYERVYRNILAHSVK